MELSFLARNPHYWLGNERIILETKFPNSQLSFQVPSYVSKLIMTFLIDLCFQLNHRVILGRNFLDEIFQPKSLIWNWTKFETFELSRFWGSNKSNRARRKIEIKFSLPQADVTLRLQKRSRSQNFCWFRSFLVQIWFIWIFSRSRSFSGRTYGRAWSFMMITWSFAVISRSNTAHTSGILSQIFSKFYHFWDYVISIIWVGCP